MVEPEMPHPGPGTADAPVFLQAGDSALVVQFGEQVDREVNHKVIALADAVRTRGDEGVVDLVPTFRSLMIHYNPLVTSGSAVRSLVESALGSLSSTQTQARLWTVPVLYGGEAGPDLAEVASRTGLSEADVVDLHASVTYEIYMMGFLPGLPYLGVLPQVLELPRRAEPRVRVPARSVAIAINQSNIYPFEGPGGWHLLGRCPVEVFDMRWSEPILFATGDRIRFERIDTEAYEGLNRKAEEGAYRLEPETGS